MNKRFKGALLILLLVLFWVYRQWPDDKVHVIFCDVGQGDANLIVKGNFQLLIDAGPPNGKVVACLSKHIPFWDKQIEIFISTHNQKDHVGGLSDLEKHYQIKEKFGANLIAGDRFRYADLYFDILWPVERAEAADANQTAVVGSLKFGGFRALFTADIGEGEELALVQEGVLEKIDVLKVAHHGSKFSSSQTFLEKVVPNEAVISVGKNNTYGHPAAVILSRFEILRQRVWRTDNNGTVEVVTNGQRYWINTEK